MSLLQMDISFQTTLPISNIIFYGLTTEYLTLISAFEIFFSKKNSVNFINTDKHEKLLSSLSYGSLVVTSEKLSESLQSDLLQRGCTRHLPIEDFMANVKEIAELESPALQGHVALVFLDTRLNSCLKGIFSIYGYNVITVDSYSMLQKTIKGGATYVILNQDLTHVKFKKDDSKEKIFTYIKKQKSENKSLAVSVVKDFNQGSLFEDIGSKVRDICNILLSPEEYLLFIIQFLNEHHSLKLLNKHQDSLSQINVSVSQMIGRPISSSASINMYLHNAKHCYSMIEDKDAIKRMTLFNESTALNRKLMLKKQMFSWVIELLQTGEAKNNRASFLFMNGSSEVTSSSENVKSNDVPLKRTTVSAHDNVRTSFSEESIAGGPK